MKKVLVLALVICIFISGCANSTSSLPSENMPTQNQLETCLIPTSYFEA